MYKQYKYITVDAYIYKYEWKKLCKSINRILLLYRQNHYFQGRILPYLILTLGIETFP